MVCVRGVLMGLAGIAFLAGAGIGCVPAVNVKKDQSGVRDLSFNRTGFGQNQIPLWFALTPFEQRTLSDTVAIRVNQPDALLALAIIASGAHRDGALYETSRNQINTFISQIRPRIEAEPRLWYKGYMLYQAMRETFYGQTDQSDDLDGYEFAQSALTAIWEVRKYNCISSTILYCILANHVGLPVTASIVPSHVFAQLTGPDGTVIEVETTSKKGFDWIHDEKFYATAAPAWLASRGLPQCTWADYQNRRIVQPWELICYNMSNQHTDIDRLAVEHIHRLKEIQAWIEPHSAVYRKEQLAVYSMEFAHFQKNQDWATALQLFDCVGPQLAAIEASSSVMTAPQVRISLAWMRYSHSHSLALQGAYAMFPQSTRTGLSVVRLVQGADSVTLVNNYRLLVARVMQELTSGKQFDRADSLIVEFTPLLARDKAIYENIQWVYNSWMQHYWPQARWDSVTAVGRLHLERDIHKKYTESISRNVEGAYLNWASEYLNKGDWPAAAQVLGECVKALPVCDRCRSERERLKATHRMLE